jgi:dihydroorotase
MPNTLPTIDNAEMVESVRAKLAHTRVYVAAAISEGLNGQKITNFKELEKAGVVAFTDDGMPVENKGLLAKALQATDKLIIYHSEDFNEDGNEVEWMDAEKAIETAVKLGKVGSSRGKRIHITHISAKETVDIIRKAKARGVKVTCDTCPHFFTLTSDAVKEHGANAKMNPPLKKVEDVAAIIEGLKDGTIDAISTDHAPHSVDEKNVNFGAAPNGIIGLETALGLAVTHLVKPGHLSWEQLVEKMSINPAKILGLKPNGWTIIDSENEYIVNIEDFKSKAKNSPFGGCRLQGKAVAVVAQNNEKEPVKLHVL